MFITFEGGEGCGKSTQAKLLKQTLEKQGFEVVLSKEPGGTALGAAIRELLLSSRENITSNCELFLFAADRAQHVAEVVLPALKAGKIVICDRFIDSTVAYQIGGRKLPEDLVRYLIAISSQGLIPDVTLLLNLSPTKGRQRVIERKMEINRFEKEKTAFHEKIRQSFLTIAKQNAKRFVVVDSSGSIEETQSVIEKAVLSRLKRKGKA